MPRIGRFTDDRVCEHQEFATRSQGLLEEIARESLLESSLLLSLKRSSTISKT